MFGKVVFILLCSFPVVSLSYDEPFEPYGLNVTGVMDLGDGGFDSVISKIQVKRRTGVDDWPEDAYKLTVSTKYGASFSLDFDSSYGNFTLRAVDLDGDNCAELFLVTGVGRGTSVRAKVLDVYKIEREGLRRVLSKDISAYFGSGVQWWYNVKFVRGRESLGDSLLFELEHDKPEDGSLVDLSLIPNQRMVRIVWDKKSRKVVEIPES